MTVAPSISDFFLASAELGNVEYMKTILHSHSHELNKDVLDESLRYATENHSLAAVKLLVKSGARESYSNAPGASASYSCFAQAICQGDLDVAKYMAKKFDLRHLTCGKIRWAAGEAEEKGHDEALEFLISLPDVSRHLVKWRPCQK